MGVEIESTHFEVDYAEPPGTHTAKNGPGAKRDEKPPKMAPIAHGRGFQLQAEDEGDKTGIEFVTNSPGLPDRESWLAHAKAVQEMAKDVEARRARTFNAAELTGGDKRYVIVGNNAPLWAHVQVTIGLPLRAVPDFFNRLGGKTKGKVKGEAGPGGGADTQPKLVKSAKEHLADAVPGAELERQLQRGLELPDGISAELRGLVTMIRHYIESGRPLEKRQFPKGVVAVMARTDFRRMFELLPVSERRAIGEHMKEWKELLAGADSKAQLFNQTFKDTASDPSVRLDVTRHEWLQQMPEQDLLTPHGAKATGHHRPGFVVAPPEAKPVTFTDWLKASERYRDVLDDSELRGWAESMGSRAKVVTERSKFSAPLWIKGTAPHANPKLVKKLAAAAEAYLAAVPEPVPAERRDIQDFRLPYANLVNDWGAMIDSLYQGLGNYGDKTDTVKFTDNAGDGATRTEDAVILELRQVEGLSEKVEDWGEWMQEVYDLAEASIRAARPAGVQPDADISSELGGKGDLKLASAGLTRLQFIDEARQWRQEQEAAAGNGDNDNA